MWFLILFILVLPFLLPSEVALSGLLGNKSVALKLILDTGGKGRGVVVKEPILKGEFITEYKYQLSYSRDKLWERAEEYSVNGEGCYVLECQLPGNKWICLDATRRLNSWGRYINHGCGCMCNCGPHLPLLIDGNWRVAFLAKRDVAVVEELLYEYGAQRNLPDFMRKQGKIKGVIAKDPVSFGSICRSLDWFVSLERDETGQTVPQLRSSLCIHPSCHPCPGKGDSPNFEAISYQGQSETLV